MDAARLRDLAAAFRRITAGFENELALAWAVVDTGVLPPVIASVGTAGHVAVDPERVFRDALRVGASGVVLAHNHPVTTGPSRADEAVTRRLVAAGHVLGIPLIAHLVVEPHAVHELVGHVGVGSLGFGSVGVGRVGVGSVGVGRVGVGSVGVGRDVAVVASEPVR